MSVLDGFMATWSRARATFGEGSPQGGAEFDRSDKLRQLQRNVECAAPAARWTGAAADSYADANSKQGRCLGQMARLDQRLGVEVDRSAAVVAAGRRDLDAVRQWVLDAASTVPQTPAGERMLYPVVSKGAGDVAEILQRSHGDLTSIARRIRAIGNDYRAVDSPKRSRA